jgi:HlyD family secretion protein
MAAPAVQEEGSSAPAIAPAPPVLKGRSRAKWHRWIIPAVLVASVAALAAMSRIRHQNASTYETVPVERGSIQTKVTATGNLNPVVDVLVTSQVSGNIKALHADWNSRISRSH